jgi:hypothetical protein
MRKIGIIAVLSLLVTAFAAVPVLAQSGHFVGTPTCKDIGTQVQCSGKVAGLGGTTFEITVQAAGTATVECINPAGNRAPGQDTAVTVAGTTEPLPTPRNGNFNFAITTDNPEPLPPTPTCPNEQWTANITDVTFTDATLTLLEDNVVSDTITVPVTGGATT